MGKNWLAQSPEKRQNPFSLIDLLDILDQNTLFLTDRWQKFNIKHLWKRDELSTLANHILQTDLWFPPLLHGVTKPSHLLII